MSTEPTPQLAVRQWVNWRTMVLTGACVAGGLTLNMMVLGITPDGPAEVVQSAEQVQVASSALPPASSGDVVVAVVETPVTVAVVDDTLAPAEIGVLPPVEAVAPPAPLAAAPLAPIAAVPAPAAAPEVQSPKTAAPPSAPASPSVVAPTTAVPTKAVVVAVAPTPVASTTAVPTTAAPTTTAPTTAAPTTAAPTPVTISYPSYTTTAGVIYLKLVDNKTISVYSVVGGDGWVYQIDLDGPRSIEVKFFNVKTQNEAEFHAQIENGRIKVES